ncbi:uncharacterized protein LOC135383327 isoform X2 [Ornithodoros turicata]|uniref:uncharacterized protein LOC135383327 isoform X2 n=1 Tax=Ornithodoros turicata TaxID=34597 RepID=UPI003139711A
MQSADKDQACSLNSLTLCALCDQRRMLWDFWLSNIAIAHVNLCGCHNDTGVTADQRILDDEVVMLTNTLSRNSNVEVLVLRDVQFRLEGAVALGQLMVTNTTLRTIDISGSYLGTDECIALADGLRLAKVIQELIMEGCYFTRTGAMGICEALRENESCITVSFGEICSSRNQMTTSDFVELALADLRGRICFSWDAHAILSGHSLLMQPRHVKNIVLNCDTGHDIPADGFCAFLEQEGTLVDEVDLNLSYPAFNLVRKLAECLQRQNGLQALRLTRYEECNEPARKVLRLLARSLEKNTTLSALHLVSRELEEHMECNYAITSFNLPQDISRDEKQRIEALAARNTVLQDRSLHFMSEDVVVKKCWVEAFELADT